MPFPRTDLHYHYPEGSTFPQHKQWGYCNRSWDCEGPENGTWGD